MTQLEQLKQALKVAVEALGRVEWCVNYCKGLDLNATKKHYDAALSKILPIYEEMEK